MNNIKKIEHIKSLCVFCGSSGNIDQEYINEAQKVGKLLAEYNIRLVYGGSRLGLMGTVADATMQNGGEVLGIIPQYLENIELGHNGISELIVVDSMHSRKMTMFEKSDGFLVLPGGFGTLDETFEILTWKQLHLHEKPVIFLNTKHYWEPLKALVDNIIHERFAVPGHKSLFSMVDNVEEMIEALKQPAAARTPLMQKWS
jgi:uncharacterized protein (TIGR00730 family)